MGRPTALTTELSDQALNLARAGVPKVVIADAVGVSASTLFAWFQWGDPDWTPKEDQFCPEDRSIYLEFSDKFRKAQASPVIICEATWLQAVKGTPAIPANKKTGQAYVPAVPPDPKAAERWLRLHRPDLYREDSNINVNVTGQRVEDNLAKLDEHYKEIAARLAEEAADGEEEA